MAHDSNRFGDLVISKLEGAKVTASADTEVVAEQQRVR